MADFRDLADGGRALAELPAVCELRGVIVGVSPNGLPAARAVSEVTGMTVIEVVRISDEPSYEFVEAFEVADLTGADLTGADVVVVDDGVETGTAAFTIGSMLRQRGVRSLCLAVPVCPREMEPRLLGVYDRVIAAVRPLARRSLAWHYEALR